MTEKATSTELKNRRGESEARRRGYQEAQDEFHLGARVRAERERLGMTQSKLADKKGTTQPTIARLEAGGVKPSLDTLHRAADALGLELVVNFRQQASA
ncbi:MAG: helix-turn-helix domain-containing protein [Actinomycetota bacterium]